MRRFFLFFILFTTLYNAQSKNKKTPIKSIDLSKINDSIPALIPQKKDGKFGFITQRGKVAIPHLYSNVGFFTEDCNLLNSKNEKVRKFGTSDYASVRKDGKNYRITTSGKLAYQYQDADLAQCPFEFKQQKYYSFIRQGFFGIVEKEKFHDEADYRQYIIYPQYQYLHIMEGDDINNPMIIAAINDKFGVIDIHNRVIIPFIYADIKRNFSWKLARLFEVTTDGKNYFYVDSKNRSY
ncbi:hypothetical protein BPO_1701 [Bergeyella porcorum]|uniref:WG repeat-containing protein n=1 Tax=Bergeyella porcorum TaxID=1735111 RepID=A0AAU0F410_9FLAO